MNRYKVKRRRNIILRQIILWSLIGSTIGVFALLVVWLLELAPSRGLTLLGVVALFTVSLSIMVVQVRQLGAGLTRDSTVGATSAEDGCAPQGEMKVKIPRGMVKVATMHLKLDDPLDPQRFEQFLDQPLFSTGDEHISTAKKSSSQVLESAILSYVREIEEAYSGCLSVDVDLRRGSFTIGLTFLAVYEFVAQYHDFVESITTLQGQIRDLVQDASKWYRAMNGRDIRVYSDISIEPPVPRTSDEGVASSVTGSALGDEEEPLHSAIDRSQRRSSGSSANVNDVRIEVHTRNQGTFLGYFLLGLVLTLLVLLFIAVVCASTSGDGICVEGGKIVGEMLQKLVR